MILVDGPFELGDEKKFVAAALSLPEGLVVFSSLGGNLHAGVEIGRTIRLKGFDTLVPDKAVCASACALAWLGGRVRGVGSNARVGFHAASKSPGGEVTSSGNALVGAYVNQLGLPNSAVVYITDAPPNGIRWLTPQEAQRYGIEARFASAPPFAPSTPALPRRTPSVTPTTPSLGLPANSPDKNLVFPKAVDPKYSTLLPALQRLKTCSDQYNANKATNGNAGMKWIEEGGGYWSACNKAIKS